MQLITTSPYEKKLYIESSEIHGRLLRNELQHKEGFVHKVSEACLIFCKAKTSTINGGGNVQCYVLPTSMRATKNDNFPMKDI